MFKKSFLSITISLAYSHITLAGSAPCNVNGGDPTSWVGRECSGGSYDSIVKTISASSLRMLTAEDHRASEDPANFRYPLRDITFIGASGTPDISMVPYELSTVTIGAGNYTFSTHELTLDSVNFTSNLSWNFLSGAPNKITLRNGSRFQVQRASIGFAATSPITIHSESGNNVLYGWNYDRVEAPVTVDVDPNSSLKFSYIGALSGGVNGGIWKLAGNSTVNVDNGLLEVSYSRINFEDGTINLSNNGELKVDGSGSSFNAKTMNISSGAKAAAQINTELDVSGEITLDSGSIALGEAARVSAGQISVSGASSVSGDPSNARLNTQVLQGASGSSLTATDLNQLNADTLILGSGFTLNADNSNIDVAGDVVFAGGNLNLTNTGQFTLFGLAKGNSANISVDRSGFRVSTGKELELYDTINLSLVNSSELGVEGALYTGVNRTLTTDSSTTLKIIGNSSLGSDGILSPGSKSAGPGRDVIGTLITDSKIKFTDNFDVQSSNPTSAESLLNSGLFDGGYYQADLRLNGTSVENDQILYGDGDVNIAAMKAIKVKVHGSPTAASLDGKEFTILAAQDGTKSGQIIRLNQETMIEEDATTPILIDYYIVDKQTNGKEDITLVAEEQLPITLQKHVNVKGSRNKQSVAALMPITATTTPNPGTPSQTPSQQQAQLAVHSALQTTTNSQVGGDFTSIHPETISSNMTVQLEQADNMLNTVLAVNTLSRNSDEEMQNLGSYFFGSSNSHPSGVWANINYVDGKVDGQDDLGSFDYYLTSYTFGSSFISRSDYDLGTFFGFSQEAMDEHDQANIDFNSDAYHLGLYGGLRFTEKLTMNWAFGHSWLTTESRRATSLGNIQESAEAEYDSQMNYLGVRANYDTSWLPTIESNLFVGLGYLRIDQDEFSETNAPNLGLTIDRAIASSAILSLGVDMSRPLGQLESTYARTHVRYDYDAMAEHGSEHEVRASFNFDPSNTQDFVGQNRGPHALTLALGVEHELDEDWLLSLAGMYTGSSHGHEVGGDLVMNWLW